MAKGRKPQPAEVAEAKGNPGKRKSVKASPAQAGQLPVEPPAHVRTGKARKIWKEYAPKLKGLGFIRETDSPLFILFCDTMAEYLEARDTVAVEGFTYVTSSPHVDKIHRMHPAAMIMRRAKQDLIKLCGELGLTPSMRTQILTRLARPEMPADGLFGQGGESAADAPPRNRDDDDDSYSGENPLDFRNEGGPGTIN